MNKTLLKWIIILLAIFIAASVFLEVVSVKETKSFSTQETGDTFNTTVTELKKNDSNSVRIISINDANFDANERQDILEKVNNLKNLGSISGGKITHEFSNLSLKRSRIKKKKTSFTPIDNIIGKEFIMTGRVYSGAYSQDKGYGSIYRLYENPNNGSKIEFTEMYLNPKNNAVMEVVQEMLNHSVNNVPMTFETIKTDDLGMVYNAQFNVGEKYYSFSTQGIAPNMFEKILSNVIKKEQSSLSN